MPGSVARATNSSVAASAAVASNSAAPVEPAGRAQEAEHLGYRLREAFEVVVVDPDLARHEVEQVPAEVHRYRAILIRSSKKPENHLALLHLACALITWKQTITAPLPG